MKDEEPAAGPARLQDEFLEALGNCLPVVLHDLRGRLNRLVLGATLRLQAGDPPDWLRQLRAELQDLANGLELSLAPLASGSSERLRLVQAADELDRLLRPLAARMAVGWETRYPSVAAAEWKGVDALALRRVLIVLLVAWLEDLREGGRLVVTVEGAQPPRLRLEAERADGSRPEAPSQHRLEGLRSAGLSVDSAPGRLLLAAGEPPVRGPSGD